MQQLNGSGKLKNVQAVREMLSGTHKSQTKKTFAFAPKASIRLAREIRLPEPVESFFTASS